MVPTRDRIARHDIYWHAIHELIHGSPLESFHQVNPDVKKHSPFQNEPPKPPKPPKPLGWGSF